MNYNKCNIDLFDGTEILGKNIPQYQFSDGFFRYFEDNGSCVMLNHSVIKKISLYNEGPEPIIDRLREQEVTVSYSGEGSHG
jgi:hypothetical protein